MLFKTPQPANNPWTIELEKDLVRETRMLSIRFGIDVGYKLNLSENKDKVIGFHLYLEENREIHYSCLDELERVLKSKPFI